MKNINDIITETYLNIITETFYRYSFINVLDVTIQVTNEGKDPWIKGETGSKIFQKMKEDVRS